MKDYPLIYTCKTTGKEFHGRTLIPNESVEILDPDTREIEAISRYALMKRFTRSNFNRIRQIEHRRKVKLGEIQ